MFSVKMYKRRIKQWELRKNLKAEEKEAFAKEIVSHVESGQAMETIEIPSLNGRPIMYRVKRHCRQKKKFPELYNSASDGPLEQRMSAHSFNLENQTPLDKSSRLQPKPVKPANTQGPTGFILATSLLPPKEFNAFEKALFNARLAIESDTTAFFDIRTTPDFHSSIVQHAFELGTTLADVDSRQGRLKEAVVTLDGVCAIVQPLIRRGPLYFLSFCLMPFLSSRWPQDFRNAIYQMQLFLTSMAATVLGSSNPLTQILSAFMMADSDRDIQHMASSILEIIFDQLYIRRGLSLSTFSHLQHLVSEIARFGDLDTALKLCQQLITNSACLAGQEQKKLMQTMGDIYLKKGLQKDAVRLASQILQHRTEDLLSIPSLWPDVWAYSQLTESCLEDSDYVGAASYFGMAICYVQSRMSQRCFHKEKFLLRTALLRSILSRIAYQRGIRSEMVQFCAFMVLLVEDIWKDEDRLEAPTLTPLISEVYHG